MADEKSREPGSITKTADAQNERISGISNVSKTVSQMQKTTQHKIEQTQESIDYGGSTGTSASEMNSVLSSFGKTITAFTTGIQNVSMSTARATKDAIGDYGKAIGQDINYNKQNMVAMALSRTTPLFGYFAAKFMETDVFKKAKDKMRDSIASTFKGIGSSIANIFKGKEKAHSDAVPKMQRGGYVEKGGMVEVHPAEVVMPIEKILERIDDSISVAREMSEITSKSQMRSLAKMSTFVSAEGEKEPVGMVKGFLRAMREVQTQYEEPANTRMLRAVLSIQDTLGATIGTWEQVWTKMLVEHPTFRQLAFGMKTLGNILGSPFKIIGRLFKMRGGYQSHISRSKNPFENIGSNIAILYTGGMWRLDNIVRFTKLGAQSSQDLASFVTGKKYPKVEGISAGGWSLFGLMRSGIGLLAKPLHALADKSKFTSWMSASLEAPFENAFYKVFQHKAAMKQLYGGEDLVDQGPAGMFDQLIRDQQSKKLPPLLTMSAAKTSEEEIGEWLQSISENTGSSAKELDKHNDRERRKGVMGLITGMGSGIWSMLKMGGGLLKSLLGLGAGGWLSTAIKGLFAAGGPILAGLTSSAFLGPLGAAIGGVAVGTWINKHIIQPHIMKPFYDKQQKLQQEGNAENSAMSEKLMNQARGNTATGEESYQAKIVAGARTGLQTQEGLIAPDHAASKVMSAQSKFMDKNRSRYAQFDGDEITKARERWKRTWGYTMWYRWKSTGADPEKFGTKKEAAFLKYLEKVGTKNKDLAGSISSHEAEIYKSKNLPGKAGYAARKYGTEAKMWIAESGKYAIDQGGQLVEKATGKIIQGADLAKMQVSELLTSSRLLGQELKKRGVDQLKGLKELGDQVESNLSQVKNEMNHQVSNATSIFNSGADKAGSLMDELSQRVATGAFP